MKSFFERLNKKWGFLEGSVSVLIGTILIRGFAGSGITMTASLFLTPVSEDIGIGIGTLSIFFSIASFVMIIWLPFAGRLIEKLSIKALAVSSAAFQALSFASLGLFNNVWGWYIMAIPQALGTAILVNLLGPIMINRWFPKKTGIILGIQMSLVWLFAAVLQPFTSSIIQNYGWRVGYIVLGLASFVIIGISALTLLKDRPNSSSSLEITEKNSIKEGSALLDSSKKPKYRSFSFFMLLIFAVALAGASVFTQHIPTYATCLNYPLSSTGIAMSFASLGGAVGAATVGFVCDKLGGLKTCFGIITLWFLGIIGFIFSESSFAVFVLSCFVHGFSSSSIAIILPILTLLFFDRREYEKIYSKIAIGTPIASVLLIPEYGFIYDSIGSYLPVLLQILVLLLIAGGSILSAWKKSRAQDRLQTSRGSS